MSREIKLKQKIPKLYRPVILRFSSLRNGVGAGLGVIFDIDTVVERPAMRVATPEGWKWQIPNYRKESDWDWPITTDQEILDEIGMDMQDIEITSPSHY